MIPPGPSLTTNSFYSVGGVNRISALAPCSLVTVVAAGLAPNLQNQVLNSNSFGPWSGTLASDSVSISNTFAPIASVGTLNGAEQITFQVPCDVARVEQRSGHHQCWRRDRDCKHADSVWRIRESLKR